jgi:hypothetical protein
MKVVLRKNAGKKGLVGIFIAVLICAGLLWYTDMDVLQLIKGPALLENISNPEMMEGEYVSYPIQHLVSAYMSITSRRENSTEETLKSIDYMVYDEKEDILFGVRVNADKQEEIEELGSVSWDSGITRNVTGAWEPIPEDYQGYFREALIYLDSSWDGTPDVKYFIDTTKIGGGYKSATYVTIAVILIALIYMMYVVAKIGAGGYYKNIEKYLKNHPDVTEEVLDGEFSSAKQLGKVWIGKRWTFFLSGTTAKIIDNRELVWAYYYKVTGRNARSMIKTFDINRHMVSFNIEESLSREALEQYAQVAPQMVLGYDKNLENAFKNNFQEFLSYQYNKVRMGSSNL